MTEQSFEELHALKIMKEKGHVIDNSLTINGRAIIQRLIQLNYCKRKIVGLWHWKKEVYIPLIEGLMVISSNGQLISNIRYDISKSIRDTKNKSKRNIRDKVEKIVKEHKLNLLSFMTLEMIIKTDVFDKYEIGEVQFQHVKQHLSQYSKGYLQKHSNNQKDKHDLSYLNNESYESIDFAYEVFYWGMIFSNYIDYQEDIAIQPDSNSFNNEMNNIINQSDTVALNNIEPEQNTINDNVSESSYSDSTSYDSGSSDSSSCSCD
jgi:hypothetical protein